jgi:PD-(D/E)XK nuclease superfamily
MNLFDLPPPQRSVAPAAVESTANAGQCGDCYPHPSHAAGSCEYCNCDSLPEVAVLTQPSLVLQPSPAPLSPKAIVGIRRLSHSELVSFQTCTRLHYYSYRLRREPRLTAEPLLVGRRVETIIKQIWRGESPDLSELPPEERALCKAYPIWWRHHTLRVKRVDIPFQVEIAGVLYIGEFDGDGEDKGEEVIVELKTTSDDVSIGAPYWRRVAQTDPQVTTYLMAARAQGRKLRRVVYDVIRKTSLERFQATPLDKRKYTKPTKTDPVPRLYANQHEHDETDDEFELRVLEDITKKPETYFQRRDIVRYEDEHQAHMRDVAGHVRLMQLVESMPEAPRNVNSCFKWGRSCAFLPVCLGEDRIDNNAMYQDRVRRERKKEGET